MLTVLQSSTLAASARHLRRSLAKAARHEACAVLHHLLLPRAGRADAATASSEGSNAWPGCLEGCPVFPALWPDQPARAADMSQRCARMRKQKDGTGWCQHARRIPCQILVQVAYMGTLANGQQVQIEQREGQSVADAAYATRRHLRADSFKARGPEHCSGKGSNMLHGLIFNLTTSGVPAGDGELDRRVDELHDVGALAVCRPHDGRLDDVDLVAPHPVPACHLVVHLRAMQ